MATSADAIKAGRAFVEISADDKKFNSTLDRIVKRFHGIGVALQQTGKTFALSGAAILAPLGGAFLSAIKHADKIQDIADRMETTTEAVSKLGYAADLSAASLEDVEAANRILTKSAVAAAGGAKDQAAMFDKLGISAAEFLAVPVDERFLRIAEGLEKIDDPLERSQFLLALFGKQATTVIPLLSEGADGLRKLFEEAEKTGSVLRGEDGKKAAKIADLMDRAWKEVKNTIFEVGLSYLGFTDDLTQSSETFSKTLKNIRDWIRDNRQLIATITLLGAALVVTGITMLLLGTLFKGLATAGTVLIGVLKLLKIVGLATWAALLSPLIAIVGAIAAIVIIAGSLTGKLGNFFKGFGDTFRSIGNTFGMMWNGIIAALRKGEFEKAWKIVQLGMYAIFLDVVLLLRAKWNDFTNYFRDIFRDAILSVERVLLEFVRFIQVNFLKAVTALADAANAVTGIFSEVFKGEPARPTEKQLQQMQDLLLAQKELPGAIKETSAALKQQQDILAKFAGMTEDQIYDMDKTREAWVKYSQAKERAFNLDKKLQEQTKKLDRIPLELKALRAGRDLIDTGPLLQAQKDIDTDINQRIKDIETGDKRERELRDKAQDERLKGIREERDATKKAIQDILDELNKPAVEPGGLPIAPFPRVKGELDKSFGDSVKGLFESADFRQTLSLGPANTYAQDQLNTQKDMLGELRGINSKLGAMDLAWG